MTVATARVSGSAPRGWKWLAVLGLALALVGVGEWWRSRPPAEEAMPAPLDPATLHPGYGASTHAEAIAAADQSAASWRRRVAASPDDWLLREGLGGTLLERYPLSGDYADLAEADRVLGAALAMAPFPSGPVISRTGAALAIHHLDVAEATLKRMDAWAVPPQPDEKEVALSLRCEITLQRGDLDAARELCALGSGSAIRLRLANIAAKSGHFGEAARLVQDALRIPRLSPQTLATLALQRASIALEAGDWAAAGVWVRAADRFLPGYWLAQAHVAQQAALEGRLDEAERRYAELARRTGNPEVIDAYVGVLERRGNKPEAAAWIARARQAWERRMALLPEAGAAHYGVHLARYGDPRRALALAAQEYRRRPTASAAATYAAALARQGQVEPALQVLSDTLARGWNTAELRSEQASLLRALGRESEAAEVWEEARRLNPRIGEPGQRFVLFYQH